MISRIAKYFGIMRAEDFFRDFQLAREGLERISTQDDTRSPSRLRFWAKWAKGHLSYFKKRKSEVKVFTSNPKLCFVPQKLRRYIRDIRRKDQEFAECYWPASIRDQVPEYE